MFFSTELLSRRDSGFGLLWLAATLGAKSTFKKLNKRSVMTADITQLCDLIAKPSEPLALRLSSNLMVGVIRVYKVKQDIFMSDVQLCFSSLKKAVHEFNSISVAELQMGQPSARTDALTLAADPNASFALNFDSMIPEWDLTPAPRDEDEDDEEYGVRKKRRKQKVTAHQRSASIAEQGRADPHTIPDNPDYLLSNSFDMSFDGPGGIVPSSSQLGSRRGFELDDGLFGPTHDLGLDDAMDELAHELGWDINLPQQPVPMNDDASPAEGDARMDVELNFDGGPLSDFFPPNDAQFNTQLEAQDRLLPGLERGGLLPASPTMLRSASLALGAEPVVAAEATEARAHPRRKAKSRLVLDSRTELTDEELKTARANYLEGQIALRNDIAKKKAEKEGVALVENMIWGLPKDVFAPLLVDFWSKHLKGHMDLRMATARERDSEESDEDAPVPKRRRVAVPNPVGVKAAMGLPAAEWDADLDFAPDFDQDEPVIEEFEQARHESRPPSEVGSDASRLGTRLRDSFDWGAPAASSSVAGNMGFILPGEGSDRMSIGPADVGLRFRSPSDSRRSSVIRHGQRGSSVGDLGAMPNTQLLAEDFGFALPGTQEIDSQLSDMNLVTLERNSLDYAKMQLRSLPAAGSLTFDEIVPPAISTAHIASSVFYHCLVLATKDLVHVEQSTPHGTIEITKKGNLPAVVG